MSKTPASDDSSALIHTSAPIPNHSPEDLLAPLNLSDDDIGLPQPSTSHSNPDNRNNPDNPDDSEVIPGITEGKDEEPTDEDIQEALRGTRKPGRKPKSQAEGQREVLKLPTPPYRRFKSDATSPHQVTKKLWAWVATLPGWVKSRGLWYIYRDYPVLRELTEAERKAGMFKNIGKIPVDSEDTIKDDNDLLNRFGCGSYRAVLNIDGVEVATGWVVNMGGGQFRSNPPTDERIGDPSQVDWSNPVNKSYEAYCRGAGLHPDNYKLAEKESDMATVTAISEMSKVNSQLTDRLVTIAERAMEKGNERQSTDGESITKALDTVSQGAAASNKLVMDTMTQMYEFQKKVQGERDSGKGDPLEMMQAMMGLVETIMSKSGGGDATSKSELAEVRKELADARNQQMTAMLEELRDLRKANNTPPPSGMSTLKEQLEVVREFRKMMQEDMGGEGGAKDVVEEVADDLAPKWLRPYLPIVGALAQGLMASFMPGAQPRPMMQNPQPQPQPQPQPSPFPQPAALPQAQPGPQPVPHQQQQQQAQQDPFMQVVTLIAPGIRTHLKEGKSGGEFAEWFMDGFGEDGYDDIITNFNDQIILDALYRHPNLGPTLQAEFPQEQVVKFVGEFMHADDKTETETPVPPEPTPTPVVS